MSLDPNPTSYQDRLKELQAKYPNVQVDWNYEHNVSICERSKTIIEPLISEEFFLSYHNEFDHPSTKETQYLIFDYDGVIADSEQANLSCWMEVKANGDYQKAKELRDAYFDRPRYHKNHGMSEKEFATETQLTIKACEMMRDHGFDLFEEFIEEIAKISNAKLAIVSSGLKEMLILPKLRDCKLHFTHILGREDHHSKEHKVEQVCKDWGISPTQAYYFTDTKSDVIELQDYMDKTKILGCSWGWVGKAKLLEVLPENQILDKFADIHKFFGSKTSLQKLTLKGIDETNFYPADFKERGQNFINNIRDWCVSRDLTWGHKIPVWYNLTTNPERKFYTYQEWLKSPAVRAEFQISEKKPEIQGEWVQETKILDTWFSSSLWPLSTLGFVETVKPQKQAIIIHGGDVFDTREEYLEFLHSYSLDIRSQKTNWKAKLQQNLLSEGFEVFAPQMPSKYNATYEEWKIWFEKVLSQLDPNKDLYLIGGSLGGNFLLKYLAENALTVKQLHLVAACTDAHTFEVQTKLDLIQMNCEQIFVYHSTDDQVVPFEQFNQIVSKLPASKQFVFDNRGHFNIPSFPEVEDYILYSNNFYTFSKYYSLERHFQNRIGAHGIIYNPKTKKLLFPKIDMDVVKNISQIKAEYHLIGGKIEKDETPQQAFLREFEEETGISKNEITKLDFVGKIFFGFNFFKDNNLQNVRVESSLFYAETESEEEDFFVDYQTSKWISLEDIKGKMIDGFEENVEFVLNKFSTNFRTNFKNDLMDQNLVIKTDFDEFYKTQTMVTAKEIFYLWIVRMITLGKYFTNKIPFEDLVITPTILDEKGRKMSKSLKNGLEPSQAIDKFSSDSLRMSMMGGMIPGRNMRFGGPLADRLMQNYRNFGNKVWNVARFLEFKNNNYPPNTLSGGEESPQPSLTKRESEIPLSGGVPVGQGGFEVPNVAIFPQPLSIQDQTPLELYSENNITDPSLFIRKIIAAHGVIYNPKLDKVLVTQPDSGQKTFLTVGGGVKEGEDLLEGWLREVQEEAGLVETDLRNIKPWFETNFKFENSSEQNLNIEGIMYYAQTDKTDVQGSDEGETLWLSLEEIKSDWKCYYPSLQSYYDWLFGQKVPLEQQARTSTTFGAQNNTEYLTPASLWILQKYLDLQKQLDENLGQYELAHSVDALYDFLWNSFADWYVEYLKTDETQIPFAKKLFRQFVITLSPFMPFETEVLWKEFFDQSDLLAFEINNNEWCSQLWSSYSDNLAQAQEFNLVVGFIQDLRSTRGLFAIDPAKPIQVYSTSKLLQRYSKFVQVMARSELITQQKLDYYTVKKEGYEYSLDILHYIVDKPSEIARTNKIITDLDKQIVALEKQLANESFVANAETEVVAEKQSDLKNRLAEKAEQEAKLVFLK